MYNDFLSDEEWKALKAKKSEDYADFTVLNKDLEIIYNKPIHQEEARKPDFFIPTFSAASDDYLLILRTNGARNYRLGTIPLK